jgi:hypothetical protein
MSVLEASFCGSRPDLTCCTPYRTIFYGFFFFCCQIALLWKLCCFGGYYTKKFGKPQIKNERAKIKIRDTAGPKLKTRGVAGGNGCENCGILLIFNRYSP